MKATEDGRRYNVATVLDSAMERSILVERAMSSQLAIVGCIVPQNSAQMRLEIIVGFPKTSLSVLREHGAGFVYRTVHSEVLGWIVSRVTGKHFADLMSERIWSRLGMEEDGYVMVDPVGTPSKRRGAISKGTRKARRRHLPCPAIVPITWCPRKVPMASGKPRRLLSSRLAYRYRGGGLNATNPIRSSRRTTTCKFRPYFVQVLLL